MKTSSITFKSKSPNSLKRLITSELYFDFLSVLSPINKSSRPVVFCRGATLKNYAKFQGKKICWGLYLVNFAKEHRCFSVNFVILFRTSFLQNISEQLPLIEHLIVTSTVSKNDTLYLLKHGFFSKLS